MNSLLAMELITWIAHSKLHIKQHQNKAVNVHNTTATVSEKVDIFTRKMCCSIFKLEPAAQHTAEQHSINYAVYS